LSAYAKGTWGNKKLAWKHFNAYCAEYDTSWESCVAGPEMDERLCEYIAYLTLLRMPGDKPLQADTVVRYFNRTCTVLAQLFNLTSRLADRPAVQLALRGVRQLQPTRVIRARPMTWQQLELLMEALYALGTWDGVWWAWLFCVAFWGAYRLSDLLGPRGDPHVVCEADVGSFPDGDVRIVVRRSKTNRDGSRLEVKRLEQQPIPGCDTVCPRRATRVMREWRANNAGSDWAANRTYDHAIGLLREHTFPQEDVEGLRNRFTGASFRRGLVQFLVRLRVPAEDGRRMGGWASVESYNRYVFEEPVVCEIARRMLAANDDATEQERVPLALLPGVRDAAPVVQAPAPAAVPPSVDGSDSGGASDEAGDDAAAYDAGMGGEAGDDEPEDSADIDPDVHVGRFNVAKIVSARLYKTTKLAGELWLTVRWEGYTREHDTQEPFEELHGCEQSRPHVIDFYGGVGNLPDDFLPGGEKYNSYKRRMEREKREGR
jgi:hypothetical protein